MNLILCSLLISFSPSFALADEIETTGGTLETESAVVDSFDKETQTGKKQIKESQPQNAKDPATPSSGEVLLTPAQKESKIKESATVKSHDYEDRVKIPACKPDGRPTLAIALGGGGARGAAHIGVLKVLEDNGLVPDYIVGNSMGAIVGGLYSAGVPLEEIRTRLYDLSLRKAYLPCGIMRKLATLPFTKICHLFGHKHYAGLWSGEKLSKYLEEVLPQKNMDVRDTKIPFSSVATNLLDGKAYRITSGRLSTAIKASAAISPLIRPVPIDDKLYVDGGVRANLPAAPAKDTGAGLVLAVLVDEPLEPLPATRFLFMKNIASRMSDILLAVADEQQLQYADVVINPDVSNILVLSKEPEDVAKAVKAGELAALKALPSLRKMLHSPDKTRVAGD